MTDKYNEWIRSILKNLPFVEWDRFTEFKDEEGNRVTRVYGWIEREKDSYKDFVNLEFLEKGSTVLFLGTSSEKHSQKIAEILNGQGDHVECQRVENRFSNLQNKVELQNND